MLVRKGYIENYCRITEQKTCLNIKYTLPEVSNHTLTRFVLSVAAR